MFITSKAVLADGEAPAGAFTETESGIAVVVEKAEGDKCDRCWFVVDEAEKTEDGCLCARCSGILKKIGF